MVQNRSIEGSVENSDSVARLESLRLPEGLYGKSLLDIGCNGGFFCREAWRRGASRVVGVDKKSRHVTRARDRDSRTEYQVMAWSGLRRLNENFDVILLLSRLQSAANPRRLLRDAFRLLTPGGMLVIECGISAGTEPAFVSVERSDGRVVRHPTLSMIETVLPAGVVRRVGPGVDQPGDPVRRVVLRVTRRRPIVMLVAGHGGSGKSTLARALQHDSARVVSLDSLIWTLPNWCSDDRLVKLAQSESGQGSVGVRGKRIAADGLEDLFAEAVISARKIPITPNAITIVEGHALSCGDTEARFAERLAALGAYVWHVHPSDVRPHLPEGAVGPNRPARRPVGH